MRLSLGAVNLRTGNMLYFDTTTHTIVPEHGVVLALLRNGAPLGFVAILGVLELIGILVRNSVILIVQIEHLKDEGRPAWQAVVEATEHHMPPIILTAAAASLGLLPIAREIADGLRDDGRHHRRWAAHTAVFAGALCGMGSRSPTPRLQVPSNGFSRGLLRRQYSAQSNSKVSPQLLAL
jgi:hypothetical protein